MLYALFFDELRKFFVVKKYLSSRKHIFDATVEMMSMEVCFFV